MKVLLSIGAFVLFATLSFPLSAGAFGQAPSSSDVHQTGSVHHHLSPKSSASITTTDSLGTSQAGPGTPQAVPEPSSLILVAVALGLMAMGALKRRCGRALPH